MSYDLVIKNGWVVDGAGLPRYRGDIGVVAGRIAAIGRRREGAREVIDAEGRVVTPGFVDGHTHMDAQIFWDPLGTCSCWHGITSVVMGNCGFTLAPCAKEDRHLVIRNLQRAEDISVEAMEAGIDWRWTTFPQFLDTLESLPKGINYSGYLGHSALRTYVMGERAFDKPATEDDLAAMERELLGAIAAGAMGFTTQLPFDRLPVWKELRALPLAEQARRLRDPELRQALVRASRERDEGKALGTEARPVPFEWLFVMETPDGPHRSIAEVARERGCDPVEAMIDLALEKDMEV